MEVAFVERIGVGGYAFLWAWLQCQTSVHNQGSTGAHEFGEMGETFEVVFVVAVDVEVVGIGRGDNGNIWAQLVE